MVMYIVIIIIRRSVTTSSDHQLLEKFKYHHGHQIGLDPGTITNRNLGTSSAASTTTTINLWSNTRTVMDIITS